MKKHVENKRHTNPHQPLTSHSPIGATIPPRHHTIGPYRQPTTADNCSCTPPPYRPASESGAKYVWSFALPSCRSGWQRPYAALTPSRNAPRLAVARNCGMASSSLKAEVNAFDRLHMVRGANSSCWGLK